MKAKRTTLVTALRTAAEVYQADAATTRASGDAEGIARVAVQFDTQAREALDLADQIEQADAIALAD